MRKWLQVGLLVVVLLGSVLIMAKPAQAAGQWCQVYATRVYTEKSQSKFFDPNDVMEWKGRNLVDQVTAGNVYTYFKGRWIGLNWHGNFDGYNRWGISRTMRFTPGAFTASNWRIDFWSPDGNCW